MPKRKQECDSSQPSLFSFFAKTCKASEKKLKLDVQIITLEEESQVDPRNSGDSKSEWANSPVKQNGRANGVSSDDVEGDLVNVHQQAERCTSENNLRSSSLSAENPMPSTGGQSEPNPDYIANNQEESGIDKTPYYLNNFTLVLDKVLENDCDRKLFNEQDQHTIEAFRSLTSGAKRLYVRLFQRKQRWHQCSKLNYLDIAADLSTPLQELEKNGFLENENGIDDASTVLELLSVTDVKNLMKHFNIPTANLNKKSMIESLIQYSKQQKSMSFGRKTGLQEVILKRAKKMVGKCIKVTKLPRKVFLRILLLFSLVNCGDDDDELKWNQNCLSMMAMVNIGKRSFPEYKVSAKAEIFEKREKLIRYADAVHLENKLLAAIESKSWHEAIVLYEQACCEFEQEEVQDTSLGKKKFLMRFCASYIFCRCIYYGVEVLQRLKRYKSAVGKLRWLIKQPICSFHSRGLWYDRLVLNLHQHLKKNDEAFAAIKEGLKNSDLREHHKLSLAIRANRIKSSYSFKKEKMEKLDEDLALPEIPDLPSITIKGKLLPKSLNGLKTVFIRQDDCNDDVEVCSVEQVALGYYKGLGYLEGVHREGSVFHTLYGLLFWNIIYDDEIPDVFRVPYQAYPLDMNTDCFYASRKLQIDAHLKWLESADGEKMQDLIRKNWKNHQGKISIVKWDCFSDLDHFLSFVVCLNGATASAICKRLAQDFRSFRSGVPDLTVWHPERKEMKMVEVKGPGDRLSTKQMVWLKYLCENNIPAEVCYVEGVSSKKLQKM